MVLEMQNNSWLIKQDRLDSISKRKSSLKTPSNPTINPFPDSAMVRPDEVMHKRAELYLRHDEKMG